jgi:hypothetical protein
MVGCVFIIPIGLEPVAEAFGQQSGWGNNNYTLKLSTTDGGPVTHMASVGNVVDKAAFLSIVNQGKSGAFGLTIKAMADALILDWADGREPVSHYEEAIAAQNLFRV